MLCMRKESVKVGSQYEACASIALRCKHQGDAAWSWLKFNSSITLHNQIVQKIDTRNWIWLVRKLLSPITFTTLTINAHCRRHIGNQPFMSSLTMSWMHTCIPIILGHFITGNIPISCQYYEREPEGAGMFRHTFSSIWIKVPPQLYYWTSWIVN